MSRVRKALRRAAIDVDQRWDRLKLDLLRRLGGPGPLRIEAYRGLGRPDRLLLKGRVLVDRGATLSEDDDGFWDDLENMYRRLHTTEIPGARVKVSAAGASDETISDEEGYFEIVLEAAGTPFSAPRQAVDFELVDGGESDGRVRARGEAVVPTAATTCLVVSDVDDTVVRTEATHVLAMARATFLGSARSRVAFPGVGALYTALAEGRSGDDQNPLLFVSRSPWNLYDLFDEFCTLQGVPQGRLFSFRDWGFSAEGLTRARTRGHKYRQIRQVLEFEPNLPVVLLGDSGQKDPEIYSAIVDDYPGRVLEAFIRDVTRSKERTASIEELATRVEAGGGTLHLVRDSLAIARHAAQSGLIREASVDSVAAEVESASEPTPLDGIIERPP